MSRIEDIMYEAHDLGLHKQVYKAVETLKKDRKNKYVELREIYEQALSEAIKTTKKSIKDE